MPMKKTLVSAFLTLTLLLGMLAPAVGAQEAPFGAELTPLSQEELGEVEGELGTHLLAAAGGALAGGIGYLITTPADEWNFTDALKHSVSGALGGLLGHWCSS